MRPFSPGATSSWISLNLVGLQLPAACATRADGDSDSNFENYDLFHAQFPVTERGVHARSWRANRDVDVDVRRLFLGFYLRVHLLALLLDGPYGGEKEKNRQRGMAPPGSWFEIEDPSAINLRVD